MNSCAMQYWDAVSHKPMARWRHYCDKVVHPSYTKTLRISSNAYFLQWHIDSTLCILIWLASTIREHSTSTDTKINSLPSNGTDNILLRTGKLSN